MQIIAKSVKGQEFIYAARSAHKVTRGKAQVIADALNNIQWQLKEGEIWFVHDIDKYDKAYMYAEVQKFTLTKSGTLREVKA